MRIQRYKAPKVTALAGAIMATICLIACQQSQAPTTAPVTGDQKPAGTEKVFVEFRGPWAFVPDPKDGNIVLAIAPKAKGHRDLYVQASNQSVLPSGVYDLSIPAHSGPAAATADRGIAQATIDTPDLQRAVDNKSRYVIRLPKPEEYVVAGRARSSLGTTYPPDASTEKDYGTAVALRYNVSSLNGFSLAGAPDSGQFNPVLLQVEAPTIRFIVAPAQEDDINDKCDTHSRESFHQLTMLLGLRLYVDFTGDPTDCHKRDPQNPHPEKAEVRWGSSSSFDLIAAIDLRSIDLRNIDVRNFKRRLLAAFYFFDHPSGDCKAPILILSLSQSNLPRGPA